MPKVKQTVHSQQINLDKRVKCPFGRGPDIRPGLCRTSRVSGCFPSQNDTSMPQKSRSSAFRPAVPIRRSDHPGLACWHDASTGSILTADAARRALNCCCCCCCWRSHDSIISSATQTRVRSSSVCSICEKADYSRNTWTSRINQPGHTV